MSLRFVLGASGFGKSHGLYQWIIEESMKHRDTQYMILVPDQYTMQIQKQMVQMHPGHALFNVDVLSFRRLYHKVMEELGGDHLTPLDDTGKNLILRKLAGSMQNHLPVLGTLMDRQGYISEVKSVISEMQQYGISPEDMGTLIQNAASRRGLQARLEDIQKLYTAYEEYIRNSFRTGESLYPVLTRRLKEYKALQNTIVVLDGFAGFTPVQKPLIKELMILAKDMYVTMTIDEEPQKVQREQQLFFTTAKSIRELEKLAEEARVLVAPYVWCESNYRCKKHPDLIHFEANIFREHAKPYQEEPKRIQIWQASTPIQESNWVANEVRRLIREEGYQYRDIGVICGSMEDYRFPLQEAFRKYDIPFFLDSSTKILHNPAMELLQGLLELQETDFRYASVMRYLRSGFSKITGEETDLLEMYLLETGVRGKKAFQRPFTRKAKVFSLDRVNDIRARLMAELEQGMFENGSSVRTFVEQIYFFMQQLNVESRLQEYGTEFEAQGELFRSKEYKQIYRKIMDLLNQMVVLMGDEILSITEFAQILEAGFEELQVGVIPAKVDQILIGDIERTRLHQVKVLFVTGVNDTNIPGSNTKGGMISDLDREFLIHSGVEMAPTTRQLQFRQHFYLYQQLTKPSAKLYITYALLDNAEKEIRPSYFIGTIQKLFPRIQIQNIKEAEFPEHIKGLVKQSAVMLGKYATNTLGEEDVCKLLEMLHSLKAYGYQEYIERMLELAFAVGGKEQLDADIARELYGSVLYGSISRLEQYAGCPYAHFLKYGIGLRQTREYVLESADLGTIFHDVLAGFGKDLEKDGYNWKNFPMAYGEERVTERLKVIKEQYGDELLLDQARNGYALSRADRILKRTIGILQKHMQAGSFTNYGLEMDFDVQCEWNPSREIMMRLQGRIDRVDVAVVEDDVYVKVIDYKSGNKQLSLDCMYAGLQMQLIVYLDSAMKLLQEKYPKKKIHPAAMFYYRVADPVVSVEGEEDFEALPTALLKEQRAKGLLNGDEIAVHLLDSEMETSSNVIPLSLKKDGSPARGSQVCGEEQFTLMQKFMNQKLYQMGKEISEGHIEKSPYIRSRQEDGCMYCPYKGVCGFDEKQAGYEKRWIKAMSSEEVWEKMEEELSWQ